MGMGFDAQCDFASLPSCWGFSFAPGCGFVYVCVCVCVCVMQYSPVDDCSAASCNFGVLAEENECT